LTALVVEQALARGYEVTAFVRELLNIALDGVKVMRGNVLEKQTLSNGWSGQDAVSGD